MPTHVHGLLDMMVALEALMSKLDQSNEQLVGLVSEQRTEIRGLRDGICNGCLVNHYFVIV